MRRRSLVWTFLLVGLLVLASGHLVSKARAAGAGSGSQPVVITTQKLTVTGRGTESGFHPLPFTPVVITTQKLTVTGKK
jgi:hypothetical protein